MRTTGWTAEEMVNITGRPALLTTFPFGKYRDEAVSQVTETRSEAIYAGF